MDTISVIAKVPLYYTFRWNTAIILNEELADAEWYGTHIELVKVRNNRRPKISDICEKLSNFSVCLLTGLVRLTEAWFSYSRDCRKQVQAYSETNLSHLLQLVCCLYAWACLRLPTITIYENQV